MPKLLVVRADEESGGLTAVAQDYLKVIWTAQEWSRDKVSTKMLAEKIGVSASTASESIRKLAEQGLVDHEKYGAVTLTDSGRRAALAMVRRHRLLETFLVKSSATPGTRCTTRPRCSSTRSRTASSPGSTSWAFRAGIPTATHPRRRRPATTPQARLLGALDVGDSGWVARIFDADPEMLRYFDTVGINLDSQLRVLTRREFAGMLSVAIESNDGAATTVELGSPAARAIWVVA